jgi:hypothetical protein
MSDEHASYATWPQILQLSSVLTAAIIGLGYLLWVQISEISDLAQSAREAAIAARPDPFTGTQARELEQRMERLINLRTAVIEREMSDIKEEHLRFRSQIERHHSGETALFGHKPHASQE